MFEVRNISFAYRSRQVLSDVSFVVSPGETVGVVGDNGAGKTTLTRILATALAPDSGSIRVDGHDAFKNEMRYRRELGYMQESPALYEDMTVKAYLAYRARLKGEPEKRIKRRLGEAGDTCRIGDLMKRHIRTLSFGQKKRVALADAMLLRPRVLLLDDVLAGLDRGMRESSGTIIASAAAFSSVIVTGHELEDLAKWCTRFLVLCGGRISASIPAAGLDPATVLARVDEALKGGAK
jgi:ABC-2 type transport system ATP-binding protein